MKKHNVIKASKGSFGLNLNELFSYSNLLYYLILKDIKSIYKQTVLGFSWAIIRPVFSMIVFSFVFGRLANVPSDGIPYPIFSYAALIPWTYFSSAMTLSTQSLISNKSIFTKVYYPRLIIPIVPVISKLLDFLISFIILFLMMAYYRIVPNYNIIFLPILVFLMMLPAAGIGMVLSALAIRYRDIPHGIQFLSQLLMYAAPVVWPASLIEQKFSHFTYILYGFYPMVGVIEGFRVCLLGQGIMPWYLICNGFFSSVLIFLFGAFYFKSQEKGFADVA